VRIPEPNHVISFILKIRCVEGTVAKHIPVTVDA
jgi:hypothetical protein